MTEIEKTLDILENSFDSNEDKNKLCPDGESVDHGVDTDDRDSENSKFDENGVKELLERVKKEIAERISDIGFITRDTQDDKFQIQENFRTISRTAKEIGEIFQSHFNCEKLSERTEGGKKRILPRQNSKTRRKS